MIGLLNGLGHSASVFTTWNQVRNGLHHARNPELIIVADTKGDEKLAEEMISQLTADQGAFFLVYVANTLAPDLYKRLVKTGQGEWVSWSTLKQELSDVVSKINSSTGEGGLARVVSFFPSAGGVGNTTLAAEAGFYLASERKKQRARVAVVDLNFQASTLADILDLEPRLDVSELIDRPERLDDRLIDVFTSNYSPRLDVFSSPMRFDGREIAHPSVVFPLLDGLSKRYDFVLIDLPHHWSPWVDNVLQGSDGVAIIGRSTVPAVKQLVKRMQHVEALEIPAHRTRVVVNQCDVSLLGTIPRKSDIERLLSQGRPIYVRRDNVAASQSANTGQPMLDVAPRRPVCKSIRQLAQWVQTVADRPDVPSK